MRRSLILAVSAMLMMPTAGFASGPQDADAYAAVLADADRPEADTARDAARKTAQTLAFAEVAPGQSIGDMIIGGGYFTRVFASAVGDAGHVVAWQPAEFIAFQASYGESITAVDAAENVSAIRSPIGAPEFPAGLDLVFTAQNYHDLHLQPFPADTAARVNAAVFAALKPGGLYVIIDHAAASGAGLGVAHTLHRIDIADGAGEDTGEISAADDHVADRLARPDLGEGQDLGGLARRVAGGVCLGPVRVGQHGGVGPGVLGRRREASGGDQDGGIGVGLLRTGSKACGRHDQKGRDSQNQRTTHGSLPRAPAALAKPSASDERRQPGLRNR